jgi:putative ABC transport system ATP-binding protein
MCTTIILQTKDLKKYYGKGETEVHALDGINLEIEAGKFVAIIGTSGSGKSTLLNMLGGLDTPTSGTVTIGNIELSELKEEQLTIFRRRRIGFIFQNYNLIPTLNVWENIVFPIAMDGQKPDKKFIKEIVELLGLEQKIYNLPNNLSGGQQQRVAIARALASKPDIVLADEPTGTVQLVQHKRSPGKPAALRGPFLFPSVLAVLSAQFYFFALFTNHCAIRQSSVFSEHFTETL